MLIIKNGKCMPNNEIMQGAMKIHTYVCPECGCEFQMNENDVVCSCSFEHSTYKANLGCLRCPQCTMPIKAMQSKTGTAPYECLCETCRKEKNNVR